jgi:hypothetical protein
VFLARGGRLALSSIHGSIYDVKRVPKVNEVKANATTAAFFFIHGNHYNIKRVREVNKVKVNAAAVLFFIHGSI